MTQTTSLPLYWLALVALHFASLQSLQNLLDLNAQRANERKAPA